ncbi:hypothetical protein NKR19_g4478 [Coniochaeta hoffmannii]|uniref:Uncharacterized protein n=1 Tax=Coniochaeta hoffmannii TaxID=91930 RepID=A0AA38RMB8_9PEZI|nr:hypothetical protein NKR19_g4478 [Coniochaeta hoffmannii]
MTNAISQTWTSIRTAAITFPPMGQMGLISKVGVINPDSPYPVYPEDGTSPYEIPLGDYSAYCHDASDLDNNNNNNNVYSRRRCNHGWCGIVYDCYFEVDRADFGGQINDWEHLVVWTKDNVLQYMATSAHGKFTIKPRSEVQFDNGHPKAVYHKDGVATHAFRFPQSDGSDEPPENDKGVWIRARLMSYNGFPGGLQDKLFAHDFGKVNIAIKDSSFADTLKTRDAF